MMNRKTAVTTVKATSDSMLVAMSQMKNDVKRANNVVDRLFNFQLDLVLVLREAANAGLINQKFMRDLRVQGNTNAVAGEYMTDSMDYNSLPAALRNVNDVLRVVNSRIVDRMTAPQIVQHKGRVLAVAISALVNSLTSGPEHVDAGQITSDQLPIIGTIFDDCSFVSRTLLSAQNLISNTVLDADSTVYEATCMANAYTDHVEVNRPFESIQFIDQSMNDAYNSLIVLAQIIDIQTGSNLAGTMSVAFEVEEEPVSMDWSERNPKPEIGSEAGAVGPGAEMQPLVDAYKDVVEFRRALRTRVLEMMYKSGIITTTSCIDLEKWTDSMLKFYATAIRISVQAGTSSKFLIGCIKFTEEGFVEAGIKPHEPILTRPDFVGLSLNDHQEAELKGKPNTMSVQIDQGAGKTSYMAQGSSEEEALGLFCAKLRSSSMKGKELEQTHNDIDVWPRGALMEYAAAIGIVLPVVNKFRNSGLVELIEAEEKARFASHNTESFQQFVTKMRNDHGLARRITDTFDADDLHDYIVSISPGAKNSDDLKGNLDLCRRTAHSLEIHAWIAAHPEQDAPLLPFEFLSDMRESHVLNIIGTRTLSSMKRRTLIQYGVALNLWQPNTRKSLDRIIDAINAAEHSEWTRYINNF